jgi:hypothetical protein
MTVEGVLATDSYVLFPFTKESLTFGFSKYGELINGADKVGLQYEGLDVFANSHVLEKDWSQGWFIDIHYVDLENHYKRAWAFAMYTDLSGSAGIGGDWKENCTGEPSTTTSYGGRKTNVWAKTDPIKVLYDGPRRFVAVTNTTLYDASTKTADDALVSITITFVFNKDKKVVTLFKDIKRLATGKFGRPFQVEFSNRGEWDIGTAAAPPSYAHFYDNLTTVYDYEYHNFYNATYDITGFDVAQMIDEDESYVGFAAFWPQLYGKLVEGTTTIARSTILSSLSTKVYNYTWLALGSPSDKNITFTGDAGLGWPTADPYPIGLGYTSDEPMVFKNGVLLTSGYTWDGAKDEIVFDIEPADTDYITVVYKHITNDGAQDMTTEPDTPYVIGEWCFELKNELNKRQFRAVTVYGLTDRHDADDARTVIDSEVQYYLDEIFNPYDLNSAVHKDTRRWVDYHNVTSTEVTAKTVSFNLTHKPVILTSDWTAYDDWSEKVEWDGALRIPDRASNVFGGTGNYTFYRDDSDGTGNITITWTTTAPFTAGTIIKVLYSTNATWYQAKTDIGTFGNTSRTNSTGAGNSQEFLFIPNPVINSTTWTDPFTTTYNITVLYDKMWANVTSSPNATSTSALDDITLAFDIKIQPESGYVKVYNSTYYYADTQLYSTNHTFNGNMSIMFQVTPYYTLQTGRFNYTEHLHITGEILIRANHTYVPTNQTYGIAIANYTVVYANLTTDIGGSYEWIVVGKDAATIDSLGAAYVTEAFDSIKEIKVCAAGMDINDTVYGPYAPFIMAGATSGTKADYRDSLGRTHLKDDWCTRIYISAGTQYYRPGYPVSTSNMIFVGGPVAQMGTEYFNEFTDAFYARSQYVTNNTGQSNKILPLSCWNMTQTAYGSGYAVIAVYKDLNGTIGLVIWGYDGQDTLYASKWFWDGLGAQPGIEYLQTENSGVTAIVIKITYPTADPTHPTVSMVQRLGTISEKTPHEDP